MPLSDWIGHNQGHKLTGLHYFFSMLNLSLYGSSLEFSAGFRCNTLSSAPPANATRFFNSCSGVFLFNIVLKAPGPIVSAILAGLAFIKVAKFLEIVMRSQHRAGINNHEQPVIWVLRRFVDYYCYFDIFAVTPVSFRHWSAKID